jgi:hypothetical protein
MVIFLWWLLGVLCIAFRGHAFFDKRKMRDGDSQGLEGKFIAAPLRSDSF